MKSTSRIEMLEIRDGEGAIYPVLIAGEKGLVLVDAGLPGQAGKIAAAMEAAGYKARELAAIVLTHQDIDHVGGLPEWKKLAPDAVVMAHKFEAPYIDGRKSPIKLEALEKSRKPLSRSMEIMRDRLRAGFAVCRTPIGKTLEDGEGLPQAPGIETLHTPGHTPGHICLFDREAGVLIAGDALNIADGTLTGANPAYTQDMALAAQSEARLRALPLRIVLCYHGGRYDCPPLPL